MAGFAWGKWPTFCTLSAGTIVTQSPKQAPRDHRRTVIGGRHGMIVNPIGVRGIGEIGIVGTAAAIDNAVYHATGKPVRDLPITPEKPL